MNFFLKLFLLLCLTTVVKAQVAKETWHWQFGYNASINFTSGAPLASTSSINTIEGSASISDNSTGQLLFYTDGDTVWNKNNIQMPNGFGLIGGRGSSTQAALIIPKPNSTTIYYLFTADQGGYWGLNHGIHYSIIDMSLNGGLGDVTTKNILLTPPPTTEKLTAIKHCNGTDYWVLTHSFNANTFNAYLFSQAGISSVPIVSHVGTIQNSLNNSNLETIGYLKASPNGKKLALGITATDSLLELFDFDASTGLVSNPLSLHLNQDVYGISFSPDNNKLYTTSSKSNSNLYQFDLSNTTPSSIMASQLSIASGDDFGALQIAPDGKIYMSSFFTTFLSVINSPNSLGIACNFQDSAINLFPNHGMYGLPNFIDANDGFQPISNSITKLLCNFNSYTLTANGHSNYLWSSGDTSKAININAFGNYWVSYLNTKGCKEVDSIAVINVQPPIIDILHDSTICSESPVSITINSNNSNIVSYLWSDGAIQSSHQISLSGNYWVDYTLNNFCVCRDSFLYTLHNMPIIKLGNDTAICNNELTLSAFNLSSAYIWNTGEITPIITITTPNTYWVKVTNQYGCTHSDTIVVNSFLSDFQFEIPNVITPNNDGINDAINFSNYPFSIIQIDIYNRWGSKIFESNNSNCIWNPSTEEDGTYFCVLHYKIDCDNNSQSNVLKNYISLLK